MNISRISNIIFPKTKIAMLSDLPHQRQLKVEVESLQSQKQMPGEKLRTALQIGDIFFLTLFALGRVIYASPVTYLRNSVHIHVRAH